MNAKSAACIGVAGFGYWGKNLVRNFYQIGQLAAVCESSPEHLAAFIKEYPTVPAFASYPEFLHQSAIKGVVIATPAESHAALAREALEAGKDLFVEKPLALDTAAAQTLIRLADEKKAILMVGHLLWYHPAVLKLKAMIHAGELGRIQYVYSNRLNLGKIRREENILWSFAPHDISVILGLLDEMPDRVTARGGNFLHKQIADVTMSCLSFPSGKQAHVFVSWLHPFKEQKFIVVGEKKMAVFDDLQAEHKLTIYPHKIRWEGQIPSVQKADAQPVAIESYEPLRAECEHFLECIQSRKTPRTDGQEALRVLTVLQQCQKALESPSGTAGPLTKPAIAGYTAHESAFIDEGVEIGQGTTIWHVSHIMKGSKIGRNCRIGQNVVIGPDVRIGNNVKIQNNVSVYQGVTLEDDVFCGPSMVFTNVLNPRSEIPRMNEHRETYVGRGATLGANCTIVCGVKIGRYAFVGAGAVVTRDIPDYALVTGIPAKPAGWMCRCGNKLTAKGSGWICPECGSSYHKGKSGLEPVSASQKVKG